MENAILNLAPDQEQMVWLIDFEGFNLSNISVKVTRETAHVLQECYPERLGLAILYNPPKFFEPFWKVLPKLNFVFQCYCSLSFIKSCYYAFWEYMGLIVDCILSDLYLDS